MKKLHTILFVLFCSLILTLSIRGIPGNPNTLTMNEQRWTEDGPLELSPERGRFALLYSLVEDKSPYFSVPVARLALPDLGYHNQKYVSLFAPGLSYLTSPGYMIGKYFGASQLGTFAVVALFALINAWLVYRISVILGARRWASYLAGITFLFATPAFAYAVTLYQHHLTTFLLLCSIYLLLRFKGLAPLSFVWFLIAISIPLDYPNLLILLPVGIYALKRIVWVENSVKNWSFHVSPAGIITLFGVLPPLLFFLWFNNWSYGNPLQFSGTVSSVKAIDETGKPSTPISYSPEPVVNESTNEPKPKKSVVRFFNPRNLLDGLVIHLFSIDRGMLIYTPVMFLSIFGIILLGHQFSAVMTLFVATIGSTLLLYAMWGDPWGGWAFGSRYLIPVYSVLAIGIAIVLSHWRKNIFFLICFFLLFLYSASVSTLGAITSNRNPPSKEIDALSLLTGRNEEKTYDRNITILKVNKSKSFVFQTEGYKYVNAQTYYILLVSLIGISAFTWLILLFKQKLSE